MAAGTDANVQAALDATGLQALIVRNANCATSSKISRYVVGGITNAGRAMWVECNTASTATAQATAITNKLRT